MTIERSELVSGFADSIGMTKAEETVDRAVDAVGVSHKQTLTEDEASEILDYIANEDAEADTLTAVSANTVKTQVVYAH